MSGAAPTPGAMRAAIDKLDYAYQNRTSHYAHWDPTGGAGAGCPACQQETKNNAALKEAIATLKQEMARIIDAETGKDREELVDIIKRVSLNKDAMTLLTKDDPMLTQRIRHALHAAAPRARAREGRGG